MPAEISITHAPILSSHSGIQEIRRYLCKDTAGASGLSTLPWRLLMAPTACIRLLTACLVACKELQQWRPAKR